MAKWNYTLNFGKHLREAIDAEDIEMTVKCLICCYRELLNKLADEDKEWKQYDIEQEIFCLESFEEDEDADDYLEVFYDLCDELGAWVAI